MKLYLAVLMGFMAALALEAPTARAHGCHAAPQVDAAGLHRHVRHCRRVSLPKQPG